MKRSTQAGLPILDKPWRRRDAWRYALGRLHGFARPPVIVTEPPPDIIVDRDQEIHTRDGTVLRANVIRPPSGSARPVILAIHPYGKDNLPARRGKRWTFSMQYRMLRESALVTF